jgi:uncharacterized protein YggE
VARRHIAVNGEGTVRRAPDTAVVHAAVSVREEKLEAARDRANARASAVLETLRGIGVPDADVQAPSLQAHPTYDHARGKTKLSGYEATRPFSIRVRDLSQLGAIFDALVDDGPTQVHGTSMELAEPDAAAGEALALAVAQARGRAEALAAAAGLTLGAPVRIEEEGDGMPAPLAMRAMQAEGVPTDVAPGEIEISARVRVWFALG